MRMKAITLSECCIEASKEVQYLGITLDSKLSFKTPVDNTIYKCTRALFTCRKIAGKSWGTSPRIIRWLYLMVVRPILTYGAIAWGDRAHLSTTKVKLHKLQRMACVRKATLIRIEGAGNDYNLPSKDAESLKRVEHRLELQHSSQ